MRLNIDVSNVFERILDTTSKYVVNVGGTRSSKTYSFLQWMVLIYCQNNKGKVIDIFRKHSASHIGAALDQLIEILIALDKYNAETHNKTLNHFRIDGNLIRFVGMDIAQKKRGVERDIALFNEANEFSLEDFRQVNIRTKERVFLDFNPSEKFWVHGDELPQDKTTWIKSTYLDNPFLPQHLIEAIERYKDIDPDFWRVYGLGELGIPKEAVFPYWNEVLEPRGTRLGIGLDFGFSNDPSALVEVWEDGEAITLHERMYQKGLSNSEIYNTIKSLYGTPPTIVADSSEPKSINELRQRGLSVIAANKPNGSVEYGLGLMKSRKILVTKSSINIIRELSSYKYKTDNMGNITNAPIDANNHAIDAARYVCFHFLRHIGVGKYVIGGLRGR